MTSREINVDTSELNATQHWQPATNDRITSFGLRIYIHVGLYDDFPKATRFISLVVSGVLRKNMIHTDYNFQRICWLYKPT